jgi:hypothetical protein
LEAAVVGVTVLPSAPPSQHNIHPTSYLLLALLEDVPVGVGGQHDRAVLQQVLDESPTMLEAETETQRLTPC